MLRDVIPAEVTASLQHLRRFAKPEFLPRHIQSTHHDSDEVDVSQLPGKQLSTTRTTKSSTSHVLLCQTHALAFDVLEAVLTSHGSIFSPLEITVRQISIPVFAPTSAAQAVKWSEEYWPTIYKNTNPYGPHPAIVRRAELDLLTEGSANTHMSLARLVAEDSTCKSHGVKVGVVIVEREYGAKAPRIVSVAADSRCKGPGAHENDDQICESNIMGHAVLRAISMVAQKRRMLAKQSTSLVSKHENMHNHSALVNHAEPESFASSGRSSLETEYLNATNNLQSTGYLCLDMDIFITHEPCIMCAMAILHSRFARVIFEKRMPKTGALCAEADSLGHGLFWREQLNWKFLTWQWVEEEALVCDSKFHA